MPETITGSITVKRGEDSWKFSFKRQSRGDRSVIQQINDWLKELIVDWPPADIRSLTKNLLAKLAYKDANGHGMNDIVVEVPEKDSDA